MCTPAACCTRTASRNKNIKIEKVEKTITPPKAEEPVKKAEPKEEVKPVEEAPKEEETSEEVEVKEETKTAKKKMYHVSKRASDNKWTVKFAGGNKVIKLFDTKVEALEYANKLAEKQEGGVHVHASKGKNKGKIISK